MILMEPVDVRDGIVMSWPNSTLLYNTSFRPGRAPPCDLLRCFWSSKIAQQMVSLALLEVIAEVCSVLPGDRPKMLTTFSILSRLRSCVLASCVIAPPPEYQFLITSRTANCSFLW